MAHEAGLGRLGREIASRRGEVQTEEATTAHRGEGVNSGEKKDIWKPKFEDYLGYSEEFWRFKKHSFALFKARQSKFIHFDTASQDPDPGLYEPDEEDIRFLQDLYPREFKPSKETFQTLLDNPFLKDFVKLIEFLDNAQEKPIGELPFTLAKISSDVVPKIADYWDSKSRRLKTFLLRKYWKPSTKNNRFENIDQLKVAFREREKPIKRVRNIHRLNEFEVHERLEQQHHEMSVALAISRLIVKREKLKLVYFKIKLQKETYETLKVGDEKLMQGVTEDIKTAESLIQVVAPVITPPSPAPEPHPKVSYPEKEKRPAPEPAPPKVIDNDVSCFISSLISELHYYGFEPSDFTYSNVRILNEKIRRIQRPNSGTRTVNAYERTISFAPKLTRTAQLDFSDLTLFKRFSYTCPQSVFLEKMEVGNDSQQADIYDSDNFVSNFLIKRDLSAFQSETSLFRLPPGSGQNPYCHFGSSNYSSSNNYIEKLYQSHCKNMFDEVDFIELEEAENLDSIASDAQDGLTLADIAQTEIKSLNLVQKFRSFRDSRRAH